jgi:hypothetical protein
MHGDFKGPAYRKNRIGHHKLTKKEQIKRLYFSEILKKNWLSAVCREYYKRQKSIEIKQAYLS